ncbi:Bcr/CflA family efflux MFS transporter [Marinospirillum alkaliphilum]|uniref:Bcr/CflA family efflux transporter n=1 Tax=Marinospirillum alkaliphilum DSM 21637 TaxID=1122209 RepID=A0A1K1TH69_9GAMM|nr:Bcr/CflA family efflux MFS transporter [Marinospirillum alkaliphilum]SFW99912.1 MFS transporter, DHA1 family, bicyclomycin/chloramphenicol resistance protein [Marinospirillum alkaliphilum DSM 21637]
MSNLFTVLALSLLLGLQPLTTDLYLPALPFITDFFDGSMGQAQLTLSALLLAFGASQLIWGPISDRFGRRPVLLFGLTLYTLAAIGSTFSFSMESLIAWRVLQGAAMGASIMCARALVRDLFDDPVAGARLMSQGLTGLGVLACISTPIGGLLTDLFGWRMALMFLALAGVALLVLLAWRLEETLKAPSLDALKPAYLVQTWRSILGNRVFWGFALLQAGTYAGLFVFLVSSSFVFIRLLGVSPTVYGLLMFSMSIAFILGTMLCRRLLRHYSVPRTVAVGGTLSLLGGSLLAVLSLLGVQSLLAIMLPVYLFIMAHGINQPCSQSGVMGPFPRAAGAASAWSSFIMVLVTFVIGHWLGQFMGDSVYPMTLGMWFCGIFIALVAWVLVPFAARSGVRHHSTG